LRGLLTERLLPEPELFGSYAEATRRVDDHSTRRSYFAVSRAANSITSTTTSGNETGMACEEFTSVT